MKMLLSDLKKSIVDMKRSDWDKNNSDPTKGIYKFKKKIYLKSSDYSDSAIRPRHVLKFVAYDSSDEYGKFMEYQRKWGAEPVTIGDPYWPEPLKPDAEGHYRWMDTILMKIPIEVWFKKKNDDRLRYDAGHKLVDAQFKSQTKADNADIEVSI